MSIAFRIRGILVRIVPEPLAVMLSTVTGWLSWFWLEPDALVAGYEQAIAFLDGVPVRVPDP